MGVDLRTKILETKDIVEELYEVVEWGVTVLIRGMTGTQRGRVMQSVTDKKANIDYSKLYPLLVINGTYDPETRKRLFSDADRDAIGEKNGGIVERIAMRVMELSGLNQNALADTEKN